MAAFPVLPTIAGTYSATLVTVSVIVAALASYVALLLASRGNGGSHSAPSNPS